jgi:hypothetical protein
MDMAANEQQSYTCAMEMACGSEKCSNIDMSLMDLDGSLKQYSYKIVTHGNISIATVDWQKTTDEARLNQQSCKVGTGMVDEQIQFNNQVFVCADDPERHSQLKLKTAVIVGKAGESVFFHGAMNDIDFKFGLLRRDTSSGEETFWLEQDTYRKIMTDHCISRKVSLQKDFQTKSDEEIRSHFARLGFVQVVEVYTGLKAIPLPS